MLLFKMMGLNVFERSLSCSLRLHLFDQKTVIIIIITINIENSYC